MNIKKRLVIYATLLLAIVSGMKAQENIYNYRKTPFYIMPQITVNYTDNENSHFQSWNKMLAPGAAITFGKEFSSLWGWRASLGYKHNRETSNWRDKSGNYNYITFNNVEMFCDLTFDYSDLVFNNNKRRHWKVLLFGGIGCAKSFDFGDQPLEENGNYTTSPKPVMGLRGGINVSYMLSKNVALSLEGSGTMFQDRFNGVNDGRVFDAKSSLGAGIVILLDKYQTIPSQPIVPTVPIEPAVPTQTVITYNINPIAAYIAPNIETKQRRTEVQRAYLYFPVNKTVIYPDYFDNTNELRKIESSIDIVMNNNDLIFKSMILHGYASPEGRYKNNERLAQGRAESLRTYIMEKYGFSDKVFTVNYTPEDWNGFKEYMENSDLENKENILNIINDDSIEPDRKEAKIRMLNDKVYKFLLKNVFTKLRHTDYYIDYEIRPFKTEEAKYLIFEHPEKLNLYEMFCAANSYNKDSEEFIKALRIAAEKYPDSSTANLNLASALIEKRNVKEARKYLLKVNDCPQKTHDLGVIDALEGEYDRARDIFKETSNAEIKESNDMLKQLEK